MIVIVIVELAIVLTIFEIANCEAEISGGEIDKRMLFEFEGVVSYGLLKTNCNVLPDEI